MEWLADPQTWISFLTLCGLEIVLGIDNIIFISILTDRLPPSQQARARRVGLSLALVMRVLLLLSLSWMMQLTTPLFTVAGKGLSGRDLILLLGGMFLIYKSVKEIHSKFEESGEEADKARKGIGFSQAIVQIVLIDLVFSLDSVITAVGMVDRVEIMIGAVIVSIGVMMWTAGGIAAFINEHPAIKVLALSFLIMIGMALLGEGLGFHIPKGYIYFSMAFAVVVEFINIRLHVRNRQP